MTDPMTTRIAQARTLLFVPGNRPERFEKAARCGADAVVLDLEDSVPSVDKAAARVACRQCAGSMQCNFNYKLHSPSVAGDFDFDFA